MLLLFVMAFPLSAYASVPHAAWSLSRLSIPFIPASFPPPLLATCKLQVEGPALQAKTPQR